MPSVEETVLRSIVEAITDKPEVVQIEKSADDMGVLLKLHVAREDMGHVIGKEGHVAKSIRNILRSIGHKDGRRINLMIVEPN